MKMRMLMALTALPLAALAEPPLEREAAALIPPFQQELLATVKQAMQAGGPVQAVEACQLLAPQIAAKHSEAPWRIGRTALKVRNPENAPDAWEHAVLESFAERAEAGEPLASLSHSEVVDGRYRYMQAIGTGEPCLACHGTEIRPALAAIIENRYPHDQALGFGPGDLRGAFTLSHEVKR